MKKSDHITSILHSITKKNVNENKHFILNNQKKNISLKNFKKKINPNPSKEKKNFFLIFFFSFRYITSHTAQFKGHLESCQFVLMVCPFQCGNEVLKKDMSDHSKVCHFREIECKCGLMMKAKDLKVKIK